MLRWTAGFVSGVNPVSRKKGNGSTFIISICPPAWKLATYRLIAKYEAVIGLEVRSAQRDQDLLRLRRQF